MSTLGKILALPVAAPMGALAWLAAQIHAAAVKELLDPARIETALLALERRLESGQISEAEFEIDEANLLEELTEIRAARAANDAPEAEEPDAEEAAVETLDPTPLASQSQSMAEAGPWMVT